MELSFVPLLLLLILRLLLKTPLLAGVWFAGWAICIWTISPRFLTDVLDVIFLPSDLIRNFLKEMAKTQERVASITPFPATKWDSQMLTIDRHVRQFFLLLILCVLVFKNLIPFVLAKVRQVGKAFTGGLQYYLSGRGSGDSITAHRVENTVQFWKTQLDKAVAGLMDTSEQYHIVHCMVEQDCSIMSCIRDHVYQLAMVMASAGVPSDAGPHLLLTQCYGHPPPYFTRDFLPIPCPNLKKAESAQKELEVVQRQLTLATSELTDDKQWHVDEIRRLKKDHAVEISHLKQEHTEKLEKLNIELIREGAAASRASQERDTCEAHFKERLKKARQEVSSTADIMAEKKQLSADLEAAQVEISRVTAVNKDYLGKIFRWSDYCQKQTEIIGQVANGRDDLVEQLKVALGESPLKRRIKELENELAAAKAEAAAAAISFQNQSQQGQQQEQQQQELRQTQTQVEEMRQQLLQSKRLVEGLEQRQTREKDEVVKELISKENALLEMTKEDIEMNRKLAHANLLLKSHEEAVKNLKSTKEQVEVALEAEKIARQAAESQVRKLVRRSKMTEKVNDSYRTRAEREVTEMQQAYTILERKSSELASLLAEEQDARLVAEARVQELTQGKITLQDVIMKSQTEPTLTLDQNQQQQKQPTQEQEQQNQQNQQHVSIESKPQNVDVVVERMADATTTTSITTTGVTPAHDTTRENIPVSYVQEEASTKEDREKQEGKEEQAEWKVDAKKMVDNAVMPEPELATWLKNEAPKTTKEQVEEPERTPPKTEKERDSQLLVEEDHISAE